MEGVGEWEGKGNKVGGWWERGIKWEGRRLEGSRKLEILKQHL